MLHALAAPFTVIWGGSQTWFALDIGLVLCFPSWEVACGAGGAGWLVTRQAKPVFGEAGWLFSSRIWAFAASCVPFGNTSRLGLPTAPWVPRRMVAPQAGFLHLASAQELACLHNIFAPSSFQRLENKRSRRGQVTLCHHFFLSRWSRCYRAWCSPRKWWVLQDWPIQSVTIHLLLCHTPWWWEPLPVLQAQCWFLLQVSVCHPAVPFVTSFPLVIFLLVSFGDFSS